MTERQSVPVKVDSRNFQDEVMQRSHQIPVALLFWAARGENGADLHRLLTDLAPEYGGKLAFAAVDVEHDPVLAQTLRVQALPTLCVIHDEQMVEQFNGPVGEETLRPLFDALTMSSGEKVKALLAELLEQGRLDEALQMLRQALQQEPENPVFLVEMADILLLVGKRSEARKVIASIGEDAPDRRRPITRLEFLDEADTLPGAEEIAAALGVDEGNQEMLYASAVCDVVARRYEKALDTLLGMLARNRGPDSLAQRTMLRIFETLGRNSPTAASYRRKLFNLLH